MKDSTNHDSISKSLHSHLKKFFDMHTNSISEPCNLYKRIMNEVEKALLIETMKYTSNVKAKATEILGINRNTLSKKLKAHNISNAKK